MNYKLVYKQNHEVKSKIKVHRKKILILCVYMVKMPYKCVVHPLDINV